MFTRQENTDPALTGGVSFVRHKLSGRLFAAREGFDFIPPIK